MQKTVTINDRILSYYVLYIPKLWSDFRFAILDLDFRF